jgi:CxxC motif-containing protein (DUF1111 family)
LQPHPLYGVTLKTMATDPAKPADGDYHAAYQAGESLDLIFDQLRFGPLGDNIPCGDDDLLCQNPELPSGEQPYQGDAFVWPVLAPQLVGLGLLEMIPDETIEQWQQGSTKGQINWVDDPTTGKQAIGRFGWTASNATLDQQVARAAYTDMGLHSRYYSDSNKLCSGEGNDPKQPVSDNCLTDKAIDQMATYVRSLSVPVRYKLLNTDQQAIAQINRGERLFRDTGCASCHRIDPLKLKDGSTISYYGTDLLTYDMGAQSRLMGDASGQHKMRLRTPPLWGIGSLAVVKNNPQSRGGLNLLHDGSAATVKEAIERHAGDAKEAADNFAQLTDNEQQALIKFIESL